MGFAQPTASLGHGEDSSQPKYDGFELQEGKHFLQTDMFSYQKERKLKKIWGEKTKETVDLEQAGRVKMM